MNVDQIEAFATELGIDAYSDVAILIISYHMGVETQGVVTREEFKRGLTKMGARSVAELKARLPAIRADMTKDANFAPFYTWCYVYNCVPGQKSLQLDAVQALAPIVLSAYKPWPLLAEWTEFLGKQTKTLSKDTWTMTLDFIKNVKPDLSNYDDECACVAGGDSQVGVAPVLRGSGASWAALALRLTRLPPFTLTTPFARSICSCVARAV